jgi:hypothetical protein
VFDLSEVRKGATQDQAESSEPSYEAEVEYVGQQTLQSPLTQANHKDPVYLSKKFYLLLQDIIKTEPVSAGLKLVRGSPFDPIDAQNRPSQQLAEGLRWVQADKKWLSHNFPDRSGATRVLAMSLPAEINTEIYPLFHFKILVEERFLMK